MKNLKKLLSLILALTLVLSMLVACDSSDEADNDEDDMVSDNEDNRFENSDSDDENSAVDISRKKLEGSIYSVSPFSEGRAFVVLNSDKETVYCIDKKGYIYFECKKDVFPEYRVTAYSNGFAIAGNNLYDSDGNITTPEDVGATTFYSGALPIGYILAEKTTATYSDTVHELGVLDLNLNWVVEPSESLYSDLVLTNANRQNNIPQHRIDCPQSCFDDYVFFHGYANSHKYLNCKTGEIIDASTITNTDSSTWIVDYSPHHYEDLTGNVMLNLDGKFSNRVTYTNFFTNGVIALSIYNDSADTYFISALDENGDFVFEPAEHPACTLADSTFLSLETDGEYIATQFYDEDIIRIYDYTGKLINEVDITFINDAEEYITYNLSLEDFSDGVLIIGGYSPPYSYKRWLFDINFEPLFET